MRSPGPQGDVTVASVGGQRDSRSRLASRRRCGVSVQGVGVRGERRRNDCWPANGIANTSSLRLRFSWSNSERPRRHCFSFAPDGVARGRGARLLLLARSGRPSLGVVFGDACKPMVGSMRQHTPWHRPPGDVVPGGLANHLVLARTDRLVLAAGRFAAYPTGFEFKVWAVGRSGEELAYFEMPLSGRVPEGEGGEQPPEVFRLEVHFADGTVARNVDRPRRLAEQPAGPVLWAGAGMAGGNRSEQEYWAFPLPPEGPLAFVCEWPANGVFQTRAEMDAALILDAASSRETLAGGAGLALPLPRESGSATADGAGYRPRRRRVTSSPAILRAASDQARRSRPDDSVVARSGRGAGWRRRPLVRVAGSRFAWRGRASRFRPRRAGA